MDRLQDQDHRAASLAPLLHESRVGWDVLEDRYGALLRLVDTLLGVVPNCDRYLEIWPPAFRTYNILVPNLLNLPVPCSASVDRLPGVVGLAMYVSSRIAGCPYCSAHSCSFAMRRGASPDKVAAALVPDRTSFTRGELAAIAVARSLARVPCELTAAERAELVDVYGERNAEWVVLGAVMMGFLNKFMDSIGVELEQSVVSEVSSTMGTDWSARQGGHAARPRRPRAADAGSRRAADQDATAPAVACRHPVRPSLAARDAAAGGRTSPPSCPSGRVTTSRCWSGCTPAAPAAAWPRSSSRISIRRPPSWGSSSRCWSERSSRRSWTTSAWPRTSVPWPATPASTARRFETRSPTPGATTRRRPPAPPAESASLALARAASYSPARIDASTVEACRDERPVAGGGRRDHHLVVRAADAAPPHVLRHGRRLKKGRQHHDGTTKPRLGVDRHRGTTGEGLRARVRHHPHG